MQREINKKGHVYDGGSSDNPPLPKESGSGYTAHYVSEELFVPDGFLTLSFEHYSAEDELIFIKVPRFDALQRLTCWFLQLATCSLRLSKKPTRPPRP